jgi:hypothetical protein
MEKEQRQVHELEAPLLPGDGDGDAAGKAAAAAGSAYALVCSLVASAISIIYGYSKQTSLQPHACMQAGHACIFPSFASNYYFDL